MSDVEQLECNASAAKDTPQRKRDLKRRARRRMRRDARRYGDDAPTRHVFRGYSG